ncbi:MAG: sensor histidine kinase [Aggregatilineales bacterium]
MADSSDPTSDALDPAYQQAVKYGKDLARIYVAERAKREKLEVAYQVLDAIFSNTPDGIVVLDDRLRITQTNNAFQRLVEIDAPSLVGQPVTEVLNEDLTRAIRTLVPNTNAPTQIELTLTKPTRRSLLANLARLESGSLRGWIITLQDQSNRKRIEYQKDEFINIAAHELRTPLGQVMGYSELLLGALSEAPDPTQTKQFIDAILRSSERLKRIIDELLQFAQLNPGHTQPEGFTEFSLGGLIDELVSDLRQYQVEQQIDLQVVIDNAELRVTSDAALLRTALYQIMLNAITFNKPYGYVHIHVDRAEDQLHIDIADSGFGIAHTELETIFQPFVQVEDHNIRSKNGLGLGLSIAQRSIAKLTGTLSVESVLGQGTTFHIQLPLKPAESAEPGPIDLQAQLALNQQQTLAYARDMQALYLKLRQANTQLQEVNNQLEEANKLKSNFLGQISHELRSPFVSIDFALQTFTRYGITGLRPEQLELLEQLTKGFKDARQMIDHLVAYAGLLSKQGKLNLQIVDITSVIDETLTTLAPMAQSRGLKLSVQTEKNLILPAGDRERISEAIWHLLHNAIKFTKRGGQITISAAHQDDGVMIQIKDTGVGISAEQQGRLWEAFTQVADPLQRGVEGLGLGLALVRYVAVAHGGKITLQSELGAGSIFSLWVPSRS